MSQLALKQEREIVKEWKRYPAYKDSGVEWLGEVPEEWEVKKCKQLSLIKRGASPRPIDDPSFFDDDGAYSWVRISDVTASNKYLETSEQRLSELGKSKSIALEPGELFVSICATVGKPIITNIKCCIHDGFVYFPYLKENREYLFYIFSGGELYKGLGKQGTQLNLNIEASLINNGYQRRTSNDYKPALCLIPQDVFDFIQATQPKEWQKFKTQYGDDANTKLLKRLAEVIKTRGTLEVLRKGIKANGCRFKLAYFKPASGLNEETQKLYQANCFSITRQLHYSEKTPAKSLDLALFLNGLPLFTAELKNPFKGQNVEHAVKQYRSDRDPREPLFSFGACLSHFAVDPDLAYMTTHLQGNKTRFLPFNQGKSGGAGNPPSAFNFSTAYLWEQIWQKESVLDLIQNFITLVEEEDDKGRKTGEKKLIFPRYHQFDAVRRLLADAKAEGTGKSYLIQHSAGSGKSNSIAWLAHGLSSLHDSQDRRVFDSIIVITDRRVLDRQLQRTIRQFEQTSGVVENIDKTSRQLKEALESGKNIIVTTSSTRTLMPSPRCSSTPKELKTGFMPPSSLLSIAIRSLPRRSSLIFAPSSKTSSASMLLSPSCCRYRTRSLRSSMSSPAT